VGFRSQPAGYPAITPHAHRGVSAFSFRDGAIRLRTLWERPGNALRTPTFKLACLKKTGFTRRPRRSQRREVFTRVNTRFMFSLCSLRTLCETTFFFLTCRTKVRRSHFVYPDIIPTQQLSEHGRSFHPHRLANTAEGFPRARKARVVTCSRCVRTAVRRPIGKTGGSPPARSR